MSFPEPSFPDPSVSDPSVSDPTLSDPTFNDTSFPEASQPRYGAIGVPGGQPVEPQVPVGQPVSQAPVGGPVYGAPQPPQYGVPTAMPVYPSAPGYPGAAPAYGPGGYNQIPADAPRPGIVPLRPLSLGEMLHGALGAFRHNPAVALGLPLLIMAIASAIGLGISRLFVNPIERQLDTISYDLAAQLGPEAGLTGATLAPDLAHQFSGGIGNTLIAWIAAPIVGGLLAIAISRSVLGDRISAGDAWGRLRSRIPALIGWTLLSALIMIAVVILPLLVIVASAAAIATVSPAGAVVVGILFGLAWLALLLWVTIRMMLIPPTIALEGRPFGESVRRGWGLSKGIFWRLLGIYLLAHLLISAIASILALPFGGITAITAALSGSGAAATGTTAGSIIAGLISTLVSTILTASIVALLYLDTRMRREGLDATLRQSAVGVPAVPTTYVG